MAKLSLIFYTWEGKVLIMEQLGFQGQLDSQS